MERLSTGKARAIHDQRSETFSKSNEQFYLCLEDIDYALDKDNYFDALIYDTKNIKSHQEFNYLISVNVNGILGSPFSSVFLSLSYNLMWFWPNVNSL